MALNSSTQLTIPQSLLSIVVLLHSPLVSRLVGEGRGLTHRKRRSILHPRRELLLRVVSAQIFAAIRHAYSVIRLAIGAIGSLGICGQIEKRKREKM